MAKDGLHSLDSVTFQFLIQIVKKLKINNSVSLKNCQSLVMLSNGHITDNLDLLIMTSNEDKRLNAPHVLVLRDQSPENDGR